jgi:large subunit ribosomal protein L29
MELEKIRNLTDEELASQQAKSAEELFRLRFRKSLGNHEGIKKLRGLRTEIARIKTIARERELGLKPAAVPAKASAAAAKPAAAAKTRKKAKKD